MANKRVIDLAELSQTVQEGQYILADSAGGTGKMDLKRILDDNKTEIDDTLSISGYAADAKAVGDALDAVNGTLATKADADGTYTDMAVGDVVSDKKIVDAVPYLFRPSASVGSRAYETIVGASVGWNQLVQSGATSVTVQSGHKYYAKIDGTESIGASTGSAITINDSAKDMVTDLTAELGTSIADYIYQLESATAGSGIAKLREWGFCIGYTAYNAGSIESVEVTEKKVVGFNAWNEEWEVGAIVDGEDISANAIRSKNYIPVVPSATYYAKSAGQYIYISEYDADKNFISPRYSRQDATFTPSVNTRYIRFNMAGAYGTTYNHDICINISSDRNGEYEPYVSHTYDLGSDVLRGIFKLDANNNLYADGDVKTSDGTITRYYGTRAYQSGDESLPDAITDGTTTVYKLTTPTTEQSTPFTSPQTVYPDGTEEFITENGVPVGHNTDYPYSIKALAEELIDIPDVPSANGTYVLKATRSASGITYAWVTG